jgi:hypothetical protein
MSFVNKWMKCHVGISFTKLEYVWESNSEISCKKITYSCIWVAQYIRYCIQHKVSATITTTVVSCPITLKVV